MTEVGIQSTGDDLLGTVLISRLTSSSVEDRPVASLGRPYRTAMVEFREMTAVL